MATIYTDIEIDIDQYLNEAGNKYLFREIERRGFIVVNQAFVRVDADDDAVFKKPYTDKQFICDFLGISNFSTPDQILEKFKDRLTLL